MLDADHYGLEKVKERILEYLAVQSRVAKMKADPVPRRSARRRQPRLGQSHRQGHQPQVRAHVARRRATRPRSGHRRTHIGSMPGRIIQNLNKVGQPKNPLFVLDEIDKMSMDFRGDPSSALLEVLDPEQNHAFNDHYLEVDSTCRR